MDLTLLGSGGNFPTPMPTCDCRVCVEARTEGVPYSRAGNATFVRDANALVDAPEAVWRMLNRERIEEVEYVFLSHHHSDHVRGLRVVQALGHANPPFDGWTADDPPTVVVGGTTRDLLSEAHGIVGEYEEWGFVEFEVLRDGDSIALGNGVEATCLGWEMTPDGEDAIYGFQFDDGESTALVTPDETKFLDADRLPDLDLWVNECGLFRETPDGTPVLSDSLWEEETEVEKTFAETVEQVRAVEPERTVLTEIEEPYRRSFDDYCALEGEYEHLNLEFGYDGMALSV